MIVRYFQGFFPELFCFLRLLHVEETQSTVVDRVSDIRSGGGFRYRVLISGRIPINRSQLPSYFSEVLESAVRAMLQAVCDQGFHRIRHGNTAVFIVAAAVLSGFSACLPKPFSRIHLQNSQRPGINIHPRLRGRTRRLFRGAILQRVPGDRGVVAVCLCEAEVCYFGVKVPGQKQVSRFHVLMKQVILMRILQAVR